MNCVIEWYSGQSFTEYTKGKSDNSGGCLEMRYGF